MHIFYTLVFCVVKVFCANLANISLSVGSCIFLCRQNFLWVKILIAGHLLSSEIYKITNFYLKYFYYIDIVEILR